MALSTTLLERSTAAAHALHGADVASLAQTELLAAQELLAHVRRAVDGLLAEVAGEVGRRSDQQAGPGGFARRAGHASPQQLVASSLGISPGEAGRLIEVGRAIAPLHSGEGDAPVDSDLPQYPLVRAAVLAGTLSVDKTAVITKVLDSLPDSSSELERDLVAMARTLKLKDLKLACQRAWARANPAGLEARERQQFRDRSLSFIDGADGMTRMVADLDPLSAAPIKAWVEAQVRAEFRARRSSDGTNEPDRRTAGQIRVDVLAMLARHAMDCKENGSGIKTTVVVRVDKSDLEADLGVGSCDELQMPISVATLRRMAVDAAILPAVMGGASVPLDLGRRERLYTAAQRLALLARDGGCAYCHAPPSFCDVHHIKWWARDGGRTDMDNGVVLCVSCHHRIHDDDWGIDVIGGTVWFTPPAHLDRERRPIMGGLAALDPPELAVSA